MSFFDNDFHFDKIENTFTANECQRNVLFIFLMILNVNTYANVILECSLWANEGHIDINESYILTIMKQIWIQINGY